MAEMSVVLGIVKHSGPISLNPLVCILWVQKYDYNSIIL